MQRENTNWINDYLDDTDRKVMSLQSMTLKRGFNDIDEHEEPLVICGFSSVADIGKDRTERSRITNECVCVTSLVERRLVYCLNAHLQEVDSFKNIRETI